MHTDTKFFTNSENNTLLDRFNATLWHNTQFFDVLVWYFRSSWFNNLYKSLENIEKIRVLVWLNIDKKSFELIEQVKHSKQEAIENYLYYVEKEFEITEDKIDVENWVTKFLEFIESGKLEIRVYPKAQIHAKVYIIRKDKQKSPDYYGSVITWSSNFSMNWFQDNLEFNVELKDTWDVNFALNKFEDLWLDWVDVSAQYVDTVKNKTWMNSDITPYDLYLKFLYEYFNIRINNDIKELFYNLPEWFKELDYQKDAVKEALIKLDTYNWFFLADVVWLGKTFIAALIWQQLRWNILIICPPHLQDYWKDTFQSFRVPCQVESLWQLEKIRDKWHERYDYIFLDEWHRFRNSGTKSYELLRTICLNKKVIIISATPYNNKFDDLLALISLFQVPRDSNIPNLKNIDQFFKNLQTWLNKIDRKTQYNEYKTKVKESSNKIRERLLKHIMIRRTRTEIKNYFSDDIKNQKLTFPEVKPPVKALYLFNKEINSLFDDTLETIWTLTYARYKPAFYLKENASYDGKETQFRQAQQKWLSWIMKTSIIKRLDSSFYAFKMSISRILESYENFIEMYKKWDVYISKKFDVYDLIDNDFVTLLSHVENDEVQKYNKNEFNEQFLIDLQNDLNILKDLSKAWWKISSDPKIDKLKDYLKNELKNKQIILFTESSETAFYLRDNLQNEFEWVFAYTWWSDDSEKQKIKRNYDPDNKKPENDIKILITTDVLAEWINLHKSNTLINYDIPWNPTRVIQRIWRVNRVWTKHKEINIFNFFPTQESNNVIALEENVLSKMEAFVKLLWEDAANLSEEEEVEVHSLFDKLNSPDYLNGEWDNEESELKYLKILREIRDKNNELFVKISNLPKKSRTWRKNENVTEESLFTFFKKWEYLKMFYSSMIDTKELDFFETVKLLECDKNEEKHKIDKSWFYELIAKNKDQFDHEIEVEQHEEQKSQKWKSNEKDLIKLLNIALKSKWFIEHEKWYLNDFLSALQKWIVTTDTIRKTKKILENSLQSKSTTQIITELKNAIPEEFINHSIDNKHKKNKNEKIEVILSEYFI